MNKRQAMLLRCPRVLKPLPGAFQVAPTEDVLTASDWHYLKARYVATQWSGLVRVLYEARDRESVVRELLRWLPRPLSVNGFNKLLDAKKVPYRLWISERPKKSADKTPWPERHVRMRIVQYVPPMHRALQEMLEIQQRRDRRMASLSANDPNQ